MTQYERHTTFLLFIFSLLVFGGCIKHEVMSDCPVTEVQLKLDWTGVEPPEKVRVLFYPKRAGQDIIDKYLPSSGGKIEIPSGHYSLIIYNCDTERVQVRGEQSYETIEAFTASCNEPGIGTTENYVWEPDALYAVQEEDVYIGGSEGEQILLRRPKLLIKNYVFKLKAEGMEYISFIVGGIDGVASSYMLGLHEGKITGAKIYFKGVYHDDEISCHFSTFWSSKAAKSRADPKIKLVLKLVKVDQTVQEEVFDITEKIHPPKNEDDGTNPNTDEIVWVMDNPLSIDKPSDPISPGGDIGDWGEGSGTEVPIK